MAFQQSGAYTGVSEHFEEIFRQKEPINGSAPGVTCYHDDDTKSYILSTPQRAHQILDFEEKYLHLNSEPTVHLS